MPQAATSSKDRTQDNANKQSGDRVTQDVTFSSTQAQILLTALRNVIIPLVQTVAPSQKNLKEVPSGPEAEAFLVALQQYISSIVQDQIQPDTSSKSGETRTVILEETTSVLSKKREEERPGKDGKAQHKDSLPSGAVDPNWLNPRAIPVELDDTSTFWLTLGLTLLRKHVFIAMPIRLLRFEKRGSSLSITLLDRTEICSYLLTKLRTKLNPQMAEDEFSSEPVSLMRKRIRELISEISQYTILSHTWLRSAPGEVTYNDWHQGTFDLTHPGYRKLVNFCSVAVEEHGVTLGWMDTICINKESSAELDESIRSMYKWYQKAQNCIVYLAETTSIYTMAKDPWFTRGWTLQELLAPRCIVFYGSQWTTLGNGLWDDKQDINIRRQIELATAITPTELISPLSETTISRKMEWAAQREVTREEDAAYSLMGIFNVSISIAYGEGAELAFIRLVKEIFNTTKSEVLDLFNWASNYSLPSNFSSDVSALIPSSPAAYIQRSNIAFGRATLIEPLTLTHLGLRIPVVLMPAVPHQGLTPYFPIGSYSSTVDIRPMPEYNELGYFLRILSHSPFAASIYFEGSPLGLALAVLNCGGSNNSDILLFKHCFAIAILYSHDNGIVTPTGYKRKVPTFKPIIFQLDNAQRSPQYGWEYDTVPRHELARHGMQFLTMYL